MNEPHTFKSNSALGRVILFPSNTDNGLSISYKYSNPWYGDTPQLTLQTSCIIKPTEHNIHCQSSDTVRSSRYDGGMLAQEKNCIKISSPRLVFVTNLSIDSWGTPTIKLGFFFKPPDDEKDIGKILKGIRHYFFPHIYYDGHLCFDVKRWTSMRGMYSTFWRTNFHNKWYDLYEDYRVSELGRSAEHFPARGPGDYQEHQDSSSPTLDRKHQQRLATYAPFMSLDERSTALFTSANSTLVKRVGKDNCLSLKNGRSLVVGFALLSGNHWYVVLKDGSFLDLVSHQVQVF